MVSTAKLSSLGIMFCIGIVSGLLVPYLLLRVLVRRFQRSSQGELVQTILAMLNCFSGGVFLGTSLMGLLPEALEQMEYAFKIINVTTNYPVSLLIVGGGFLLILVIESITVQWYSRRRCRVADSTPEQPLKAQEITSITRSKDANTTYGIYQGATEHHLSETSFDTKAHSIEISKAAVENGDTNTKDKEVGLLDMPEAKMTPLHSIVLLIALSIHMTFDGLELGLVQDETDVWGLLAAVSIHKVLIFFSMGLTICESVSTFKFVAAMIYMSLVSPIGVGVGIAVSSDDHNVSMALTSAILQAVAVGTFFYVATFEILMKEFKENSMGNRILKAISVVIGYAVFGVVKHVMPE